MTASMPKPTSGTHRKRPLIAALACLLCTGIAGGTALAQQTVASSSGQSAEMTPPSAAEMAQMRQDVAIAANWPLPRDFFPRMSATLAALRQANIHPPYGERLTLDQTIQKVGAAPGVTPILKAHGFTPRDFVMGLTCFGITRAVLSNPQAAASNGAPALNPANVELINSDQSGVNSLMAQMNNAPPG